MRLFEQIADSLDQVTQCGIDWDKYNKISRKIKNYAAEIIKELQADVDTANSEELLVKVWDFLHAGFFVMAFSQTNPRDVLEKALVEFEPQIRDANEENMSHLEGKSFEELKNIMDISRRLADTQLDEECV